jgi:hypothetical protein
MHSGKFARRERETGMLVGGVRAEQGVIDSRSASTTAESARAPAAERAADPGAPRAELPRVTGGGYDVRFDPALTQMFIEVRDPRTGQAWVQFPPEEAVRRFHRAAVAQLAALNGPAYARVARRLLAMA